MRAVYRVCTVRLRARGSAVHKVCLVFRSRTHAECLYLYVAEAKSTIACSYHPSRARNLDLSLSCLVSVNI